MEETISLEIREIREKMKMPCAGDACTNDLCQWHNPQESLADAGRRQEIASELLLWSREWPSPLGS